MGVYINPGNSGFAEINDADYVDKTKLIECINQTVGRTNKLTCISRPRRIGKSYAAKMLAAYYDCSCDSHSLFDDKQIAQSEDYEKHLNQYNVIYLDITSFTSTAQIEKVHSEETVALHYNKEDSLRSVIKLAYYTYRDHYLQFEELPTGEGYVDVVYLPLPDSDWPALVIELKWKKTAEGAIEQILKKNYPAALEGIGRPIPFRYGARL